MAMVHAEKIVTALDRGEANTRWRDFADIYTLARFHSIESIDLRASLEIVADYRHVALRPLLPFLAAMPPRAQPKWRAWRRRIGRDDLPEHFTELLDALAQFADPVLAETVSGHWDPRSQTWTSGRGPSVRTETWDQ